MPVPQLVASLLSGRGGFLRTLLAIPLVKAVDASRGIDELLLAGEKRMARRANFNVQVAILGGTSLKALAARAGNRDFLILRMYFWFHDSLNPQL